MWTRSWKPSGCRDNQRQAITSSRSEGGVLGSNPSPLTKTPETKCPFWKNVLTFPAKEVRDQHSTLWYWSKQPLKIQSWPPSRLSYTWHERRHLFHLLFLLPLPHPLSIFPGRLVLGKGKASPCRRTRRTWKWSGTARAEGARVMAFPRASQPRRISGAGSGARRDGGTEDTRFTSSPRQQRTYPFGGQNPPWRAVPTSVLIFLFISLAPGPHRKEVGKGCRKGEGWGK